MIKRTSLWILYFLVCGAVIAAAIHAGSRLNHCHECPAAYTVSK
jgi:hypothetical protein